MLRGAGQGFGAVSSHTVGQQEVESCAVVDKCVWMRCSFGEFGSFWQ